MIISIQTHHIKIVGWNCQGVGNEAFCTHAHELYRLHRPQILIIIEPKIVDEHAQAVIDTLPCSHSQRANVIGFSGGIWIMWNEDSRLIVEILITNEYSFTCQGTHQLL